MKQLITLVLIFFIGGISFSIFGQETKKENKKGGFAVGGYDNTRQEETVVKKRSIQIPEEAEPAEEAIEMKEKAAPVMATSKPEAEPEKEAVGNASVKKNKGVEGKKPGQATRETRSSKETKKASGGK